MKTETGRQWHLNHYIFIVSLSLSSLSLCLHCLHCLSVSVFIVSLSLSSLSLCLCLHCLSLSRYLFSILSLYNIVEWTSSINSIRQGWRDWEIETEIRRGNEDRDNERQMKTQWLRSTRRWFIESSSVSHCLYLHCLF